MNKKIPELKTDREAIDFLENADLSEYDFSQFKLTKFNFLKESEESDKPDIPRK